MAHTSRRFRVAENEMGYYHCIPAVHLHDKCRSCQDASRGGEIQEERYKKAMEAKAFFMSFYNADCPRICIENPTPMKIVGLPPYTQAIQPYHFGHEYSKRTCLWLKGLPPLMATCIMEHHVPYVNGGCKDAHGNYRRFQGRKERDPKIRSKTFPGVAKAMADQWCAFMEDQQ